VRNVVGWRQPAIVVFVSAIHVSAKMHVVSKYISVVCLDLTISRDQNYVSSVYVCISIKLYLVVKLNLELNCMLVIVSIRCSELWRSIRRSEQEI
jgi:hypothetical protein